MTSAGLSPDGLFSLRGRTALVTGGSLGIGAMAAEGLVAAGADVLVVARTAADVEATATRLDALDGGGSCVGVVGDLGSVDGCRALAAAVGRRVDAIDVLVHSAGTTALGTLTGDDEADWDRILDLNLKAVHFLTSALLPLLRARATADEPSRVIVIGSTSGVIVSGLPDYAYGASKAGVQMLARYLAGALAPDVLVNAIAPGMFPTRMTAFLEHEALRDPVLSTIPLGRPGRPEEIAGPVVLLASRAGGYTTGEVLVVDGGRAGIGRADPVAGL